MAGTDCAFFTIMSDDESFLYSFRSRNVRILTWLGKFINISLVKHFSFALWKWITLMSLIFEISKFESLYVYIMTYVTWSHMFSAYLFYTTSLIGIGNQCILYDSTCICLYKKRKSRTHDNLYADIYRPGFGILRHVYSDNDLYCSHFMINR